jgi:integrase
MAKMKPPTVPVVPVPIIRDDELVALVRACGGTGFADYRDAAIICLLLDTGMRRAELGRITLDELDLRRKNVRVFGKGAKVRDCAFGANTARALDRYLRKARARHRDADATTALWLGHAGPMTDNGIYQAVLERAKKAGLEGIHPHQFRHTWAHKLSAEGMPESQLMHLAGWSSTQMAQRYGASAVGERARATYKRMSPVDKL